MSTTRGLEPKKKFKSNRNKHFTSLPCSPSLQLHLLEKVQITDSRLRTIPTEILLYCCNIKSLDLARNQLSTWPTDFTNCQFNNTLEALNLSENMYISLPTDFWHLSKLKHLNFQHNQLTSFPLVLCQMPTLVTINLSFNVITTIPPQISRLHELRGNGPAALPCELYSLSSLKRLSIQCYKLFSLSVELIRLNSLQKLNESSSRLSRFAQQYSFPLDSVQDTAECLEEQEIFLSSFFQEDTKYQEDITSFIRTSASHREIREKCIAYTKRRKVVESKMAPAAKVLSLRELSSRTVIRLGLDTSSLPHELRHFVSQSRSCGLCARPFVEAISEHVYLVGSADEYEVCRRFKFLFKLNKYLPSNLPIMFPLCSYNCVLKFPQLVGLSIVRNKQEFC